MSVSLFLSLETLVGAFGRDSLFIYKCWISVHL